MGTQHTSALAAYDYTADKVSMGIANKNFKILTFEEIILMNSNNYT